MQPTSNYFFNKELQRFRFDRATAVLGLLYPEESEYSEFLWRNVHFLRNDKWKITFYLFFENLEDTNRILEFHVECSLNQFNNNCSRVFKTRDGRILSLHFDKVSKSYCLIYNSFEDFKLFDYEFTYAEKEKH